METKKVLKKMKDDVGSVLSTVANKAEFVAKLSKIKLDIAQKNIRVNNCMRDIGEYVYNRKKDFLRDSYISNVITEIEKTKQEIEDLKTKVENIKQIQKERNAAQGESKLDRDK